MSENETGSVGTISATPISDPAAELDVFNRIVSAIQVLQGADAQMRVVKSALTFLGWTDALAKRSEQPQTASRPSSSFSEDRSLTAKQFLLEKKPHTDIERVTCLAYYLTHYRDTPHFKTLDISKLNTDAAQIKLSNAAAAVENATDAGLLVSAGKGNKQLSAIGELYVQALPDREAAKASIAHAKPRRKNKKNSSMDNGDEGKEK